MASTKVETVVNNAKKILQESGTGTRWTDKELVDWLNEAYQAITQIKPDASSVNTTLELSEGTRQSIPEDGLRLLEVVRNTASGSKRRGILVMSRRTLDTIRPGWYGDPASLDIECYVVDDQDPTHFDVYPPAKAGAEVAILYSAVPAPHDSSNGLSGIGAETIKLNDAYAPVIVDYLLYRAFSKDAENERNLNRATMHHNAYLQALGQKVEVDRALSPNAPDMSSNPPRGGSA